MVMVTEMVAQTVMLSTTVMVMVTVKVTVTVTVAVGVTAAATVQLLPILMEAQLLTTMLGAMVPAVKPLQALVQALMP